MTIKLGEQLETSLAMRIAEGLQTIVLSHDFVTFPSLKWVDELHETLSDDARLKLDRFCGEPGLTWLIYQQIGADLHLRPQSATTQPSRALVELEPFRNTIAYARGIVTKLKSIPERYRATVALPVQLSDPLIGKVDNIISLGSDVSISTGAMLPTPFPMQSPLSRVDNYLFIDFIYGTTQEREVYSDRMYFTMPILGYASRSSSSALCRSFEDYLKAFYGAGMAESLFNSDWLSGGNRDRLPYVTIHTEAKDRELLSTEKLEQELLDSDHQLSTRSFTENNNEDVGIQWRNALGKIGTIFSDDKDARKLFTACIWYYRAMINKRPLDRLLEATIAIEVLLGDRQVSEGVGLSNLLGNRCAFLIGNTSTQRNNILKLFSNIYGLRSNIVHEGRHKLEPGESKIVQWAVQLCGTIISKEMDVRKPPPAAV